MWHILRPACLIKCDFYDRLILPHDAFTSASNYNIAFAHVYKLNKTHLKEIESEEYWNLNYKMKAAEWTPNVKQTKAKNPDIFKTIWAPNAQRYCAKHNLVNERRNTFVNQV